jgi:hypothetical protein
MSKKPNIVDRHIAALQALGKSNEVEAGWFESNRYKGGKTGGGKIKDREGKTVKTKEREIDPKKVGMSIAWVMRIQNFGATIKRKDGKIIRIPPRPFMQLAYANFLKRRKRIQARMAEDLLKGKIKPEQVLGQIGLELEGCIVDAIRDGDWQKNAPSTVEEKGFDKPLIDTSQAWQGVSSVVNGKAKSGK